MALIKCKECGKEISNEAVSCPECGFIYKRQKNNTLKIIIISLCTIICCSLCFYGILFLFSNVIPKYQINKEVKKYYGSYSLVSYNFDNLPDDFYGKAVFDDYEIINQISVTSNNASYIGNGFGSYTINTKTYDFVFSNSIIFDINIDSKVFLVTKLNQIIKSNYNIYDWAYRNVCFEKVEDGLSQIECPLQDNTVLPDLGIKYKLNQ